MFKSFFFQLIIDELEERIEEFKRKGTEEENVAHKASQAVKKKNAAAPASC